MSNEVEIEILLRGILAKLNAFKPHLLGEQINDPISEYNKKIVAEELNLWKSFKRKDIEQTSEICDLVSEVFN